MAHQIVIKFLLLQDLFNLSLTSGRTKNILSQYKTNAGIHLQIEEKFCDVEVTRESKRLFIKSTPAKIEGLTKHLLSCFSFQYVSFSTYKMEIFIWKYFKQFNNIRICGAELSPEHLKILLEHVKTDHLFIHATNKYLSYQYPPNKRASKMQSLKIQNPTIFNGIAAMDDQKINLRVYQQFARRVNQVLIDWIYGATEILDELIMHDDTGEEKMNPRALFAGIKAIRSTVKFNNLGINPLFLNATKLDIRRKKDGLLATVFVEQSAVLLMVWTEKQLERMDYLDDLTKDS